MHPGCLRDWTIRERYRPNARPAGSSRSFPAARTAPLTEEIAEFLGVPVGHARLQRFPDTEVSFQIDENIRGTDVFVVQPTCADVDRHLVELCVMIDAFRRSSASRITAVIPYYGYARQDRKDKPRVPISAKLMANLITAAGANRVLTMDLHKAQIQGFFDIPVDHLFAAPVIIEHLRHARQPEPDDRVAGRGRRRTRARVCEAARRRAGDHRQAAFGRRHGGSDERHRRRRRPDLHPAGRHHRHGGHDREGRRRAQGQRGRARVRLRGARRAVGPGDRAPRSGADRPGDHHQHDPARRPSGRNAARRSSSCRWRACSARRFGVFTRRLRSRRCSCSAVGSQQS